MAEVPSAAPSIPQAVENAFDFYALPYTPAFNSEVEKTRRGFPAEQLMLDRLLQLGGVDAALYPPASPAPLRHLLQAIYACPLDRLKRDVFTFYLLLDCDFNEQGEDGLANSTAGPSTAVGRTIGESGSEGRAAKFARRRCMPQHWQSFVKGYWAVDHGMWEDALRHLTSPAISALNFVPETLTVFATHISPPSRCLRLVHQFFSAVKPDAHSSDFVTHLRVLSIAFGMSLWDAFAFIREQSPPEQASLREGVWAWALGAPLIPAGVLPADAAAATRKAGMGMGVQKDILQQMLHMPMDTVESNHLSEFLAHPPRPQHSNFAISPKALDVLHDLVVLRLVHRAQYEQSIALDKALSGRAGADGTAGGVGEEGRQRRRELIREFIDVLPPAQRKALSLLPPPAQQIGSAVKVNGHAYEQGDEGNGDMEMDTAETVLPAFHATPSLAAHRASAYADLSASQSSPSQPARPVTPRVQAASSASTARTVSVSSPFGGPPQFRNPSAASLNGQAGSLSRNVSGVSGISSLSGRSLSRLPSDSPFVLPPGTKVDVPRPSEKHTHVGARNGSGSATKGHGRTYSGEQRVGRHVSIAAPDEDASIDEEDEDAFEGDEDMEDSQVGEDEEMEDISQRSEAAESEVSRTPAPPPRSSSKGKSKASNEMPPPPVPQPPPSTVRRSARRAGSATPSVASTANGGDDYSETNDRGHDNDVSPTPSRASRASSRGMTRSSTIAQLGDEAEGGTPAKRLRSSKSVANLSSRASSRQSSVADAESEQAVPRARTRSTPGASLAKSSTTADLSSTPSSKTRATRTTTTRTRRGQGEADDDVPDLPGSFTVPGSVRRSARRAGSVTSSVSSVGSDEETEKGGKLDKGKGRAERSVSPAMSMASVASSTRSTRSRAAVGAGREGSATPKAKRR